MTRSRAGELRRSFAALHRPLSFAAKDSFGRIDDVAELGVTLRRAAAALADSCNGALRDAFAGYADKLAGFDQRDRSERVRLVALGLRLCATHREGLGAAPSAPATRPVRRRPATEVTPEGIEAPPTIISGVGPAIATRLAARGIETVEDLLFLFPRGYRDQRVAMALDEVREGQEVTTTGVVVAVRRSRARGRRYLEVGLAAEATASPRLWCIWFGGPAAAAFERGDALRVSGPVRRYRERLQIAHPDCAQAGAVRLLYPEVPKVAPKLLERACGEAVRRFAHQVLDGVPERVAHKLALPTLPEALAVVHLQGDTSDPDEATLAELDAGKHPAQRRLAFEALFSLQLAVATRRRVWREQNALPCRLGDAARQRLAQLLPFELTAAQLRVLEEILDDIGRERPMHRLMQGDVGSGKTVVAFAAMLAALDSGRQAMLMAPTTVLAEQHYRLLGQWCEALGFRCALMTSEMPRAARESALALADAGELHLLIGTHALLGDRVSLPNVGVAVVDEQHRFGVMQRVRLRERGGAVPHLLVMTATPIPRTLALTVYGELDVSVIDERPPGRTPPITDVHPHGRLDPGTPAYALVQERLEAGDQVFVVCPLVEESEQLAVTDASSTAQRLRDALGGRFEVGLVHGRLAPEARDHVIAAYRAGKVRLLVATTVIEVGIDIPGANVMVVEHAERFGLAQLHQLRGRVGRSEDARSWCMLLSGAAPDSPSTERLRVLARTDDGFEIAEADLAQRGPGELFGTRQAGIPRLPFTDLQTQLTLLSAAQRAAQAVIDADPRLERAEHAQARRAMERRWRETPLPGAESG